MVRASNRFGVPIYCSLEGELLVWRELAKRGAKLN
jgi:hypothetical protein